MRRVTASPTAPAPANHAGSISMPPTRVGCAHALQPSSPSSARASLKPRRAVAERRSHLLEVRGRHRHDDLCAVVRRAFLDASDADRPERPAEHVELVLVYASVDHEPAQFFAAPVMSSTARQPASSSLTPPVAHQLAVRRKPGTSRDWISSYERLYPVREIFQSSPTLRYSST